MIKFIIVLGVLAFTNPALANELTTDTVLGASIGEAQNTLADMGYQVRKSEMENGKIEFYVVKGSEKYEIYVSLKTGKITRLKNK